MRKKTPSQLFDWVLNTLLHFVKISLRTTISLKKSYKKGKESNQGNSLVTFNFAIFNLISLCKKMNLYNLISMR